MEDVKQDANEVAEESSASTDANAESSTATDVNESEDSSTELTPEEKEEFSRFDKHPRFKELNAKAKQLPVLEAKLKELEDKISQFEANATPDETEEVKEVVQDANQALMQGDVSKNQYVTMVVKDLVEKGFEENTAKAIAEVNFKMFSAMIKSQIDPISQNITNQNMERTINKFKASHKDCTDETLKEMGKELSKLPKGLQDQIAASGDKGLEMLYKLIGASKTAEAPKSSGSIPGKSKSQPTTEEASKWTDEKVGKLSQDEYERNRIDILKEWERK